MADAAPLLRGAVVISLPDRHHDDEDGRQAADDAGSRRGRTLRRRAAVSLMVLAAFALAGHCYSPEVAARLFGEERKWSDGGAASFLLPLYPKKAGGVKAAAAEGSTAVLPQRQYYTSINIGNPARPYFLDIDTGTDLTWIQCDAPCANCTKVHHFHLRLAEFSFAAATQLPWTS